jgi:tRNA(fMet)-specific endonuclease VapC
MKYLLDTDTCIACLRSIPSIVNQRLLAVPRSEVSISLFTAMELLYGAEKGGYASIQVPKTEAFLDSLTIQYPDLSTAKEYGLVRAEQERNGKPIGALDYMIAAHARELNLTLVTNNLKEFQRVSRLTCVSWHI